MQNLRVKSISSFIFTLSTFLLVFSSMNLFIEYTSNYYATGNVNIFKFFFDFKTYLIESSAIHYNEQFNKRILFFIPLLLSIISGIVFLFSRKSGKTNTLSSLNYTFTILFFGFVLGFNFALTFALLIGLYFALYLYNKNKENEKINKFFNSVSLIKSTLFLVIIQTLLVFFVLNIAGEVVGKRNHYLNNQIATLNTSMIGNGCFYNQQNTLYNLKIEECYHNKFSDNLNDSKIFFLNLLDDNGGVLDYANLHYFTNSIVDSSVEDTVYIYQKAYEGLVLKNNKFKSQKYYNENNDKHNLGDIIIENEKAYYELSKTMNPEDFKEHIENLDQVKSLVLQNIFKKGDYNFTEKITMSEIKDLEEKYYNVKNNKNIKNNFKYVDLYSYLTLNYKELFQKTRISLSWFFNIVLEVSSLYKDNLLDIDNEPLNLQDILDKIETEHVSENLLISNEIKNFLNNKISESHIAEDYISKVD